MEARQLLQPEKTGRNEAKELRLKYPDRLPVLVEKAERTNLPQLKRNKFLLKLDMRVLDVLQIIKENYHEPPPPLNADEDDTPLSDTRIRQDTVIFLCAGGKTLRPSDVMEDVYEEHHSADGFLRLVYRPEGTLGFGFAAFNTP